MTKFTPENHIIGKVYDLTQENMQAMLNHIDKLESENVRLREALIAIHEDDWIEGIKTHGSFKGQTLEEIAHSALER